MVQMARYYEGMSLRALGLSCLVEGQFAKAEQYLCQAAQILGPQADLASYLASLYAQTGRFRQCARQQEKAPIEGKDAAAGAQKLAQAQWQAGQREQAMMTLADAMLKVGPDARLHLQLGLFHANMEEFPQAVESLARAAEADCTSAKAHHWLGLAAMAAGNLRLAIRSLQRALQLRPTDVMLAYQLALAARTAAGAGCRIVVQLPQNLVLQPNTTLAEQLAGFVTNEKEFVEAFLSLPPSPVDKELFETLAGIVQVALAQNENYADLQYILASVQRRLGRLDQALEHASAAARINPRYVSAHLMLADLLDRLQQPEEAMEHMKAAIRCGADWPDVHCQAGQLMMRNNQPLRAREHFQRALQLNANYDQATSALQSLAA
jgi:tetratricopeptide (TPR) repeat protein